MLRILHLADIHWRGITRHDEYTRSFELLHEHIKRLKPDLIFIGGDIFHTKTQGISPEIIDRLCWMFKSLANETQTHMILGNHDGNLANEDRQDVISPIVKALNHPNLFLYKKSGVYEVPFSDVSMPNGGKVNLCVFSCFDKLGWSGVNPKDDYINIAAYHGSISGCKTDSEWIMREGEEDISLFERFDFGLLGDIHKQQYLARRQDKNGQFKPWIAYPGSMIQQNFGEDITKGFLIWDIRSKHDWDVEFVKLENKQPFITVPWMGTVDKTVSLIKETTQSNLFPGSRFRVSSSHSIAAMETRQLQEMLRKSYQASELTFKYETGFKSEHIQTNSGKVHKTSLRNDVRHLQGLYREFLMNNTNKYGLSLEQIKEAEEIIASYLNKFNVSEAESPRDIIWSIKDMQFDNLFRYGDGNTINFSKLEGIVGIFANNRAGKSSVVGAMMYGLFNTTDRGPLKNGNIINYNKKYGNAKLKISVAGNDYIVERQSLRSEPPKRKGTKIENFDADKTTTNLNLFKVNADGSLLELNSVTRDDTDKEIRRLIGKPEDFLLTAFSNQGGINRFIEEGATQRKTILNRFLDLDIFDKLFGFAKDDFTLINNKTAKFTTGGSWEQAIAGIQKSLDSKQDELVQIENEIRAKREKIDTLRFWILQNKDSRNDIDPKELPKVQDTIKKHECSLTLLENDEYNLNNAIIKIDTELKSAVDILYGVDITDLHSKYATMQGIAEKMKELSQIYKEQDSVLQNQEKSIKKLETVPCGDQFPECRFIKDSHEDKKLVTRQKQTVRELLDQLNSISATLALYQEEKLEQQIRDHEKMTNNVTLSISQLETLKSKMEVIQASKSKINLELTPLKEKETEILARMGKQASCEYELKKQAMQSEEKDLKIFETRRNSILVGIGSDEVRMEQTKKNQAESVELLNQLKIYETIQSAFNKNGIPAMVLKTQLPAINQELAKLLSNVVDFKITLETDITSNVMDVYLEDAISRRIIELASGMEKMIASLALRVALINLSSLPKPDIFIIDEGFGVLDDEGLVKCMMLLSVMKTYFRTILVISHVSAIKEVADHIVEITNLGLESKIVV